MLLSQLGLNSSVENSVQWLKEFQKEDGAKLKLLSSILFADACFFGKYLVMKPL